MPAGLFLMKLLSGDFYVRSWVGLENFQVSCSSLVYRERHASSLLYRTHLHLAGYGFFGLVVLLQ